MKTAHRERFEMNWFDILKNAGLRQSQRQGFRLDDKDEDYVLEENNCLEELRKYFMSIFGKSDIENKKYRKHMWGFDINDEFGFTAIKLYDRDGNPYPDEYYCKAKKYLKNRIDRIAEFIDKGKPYEPKEHRMSDGELDYKFSHFASAYNGRLYYRGSVIDKTEHSSLVCYISEHYEKKSRAGESNNEDTQKAAGAVTSSTPGIHRVRYSPKKKKEEDE